MSDELTSPAREPNARVRFGPPVRDALIDDLLRFVNVKLESGGLGLGLTLQIGGCVVTGDLIGVAEYFKLYADSWEKDTKIGSVPDAGPTWTETLRLIAKPYRDAAAAAEGQAPGDALEDWEYIHLKNAQYVFGAAMAPGNAGFLWRGRLADVQAFARGRLSKGAP